MVKPLKSRAHDCLGEMIDALADAQPVSRPGVSALDCFDAEVSMLFYEASGATNLAQNLGLISVKETAGYIVRTHAAGELAVRPQWPTFAEVAK